MEGPRRAAAVRQAFAAIRRRVDRRVRRARLACRLESFDFAQQLFDRRQLCLHFGDIALKDAGTISIPDRPGNNRIDTLENILDNPRVDIVFLVPGLNESLRINGVAEIVVGPELCRLAHRDRVPKTAIRVRVEEVFFHCAKALIRSRLWDPETRVPKESLPPLGAILADQIAGLDGEAETAAIENSYRTRLY